MIAIEEAAPAAKIAKKLERLNEGHLEFQIKPRPRAKKLVNISQG